MQQKAVMPPLVLDYIRYMRTIKGRSPKTAGEYEHDLLTFFRYEVCLDNGTDLSGDDFSNTDISGVDIERIRKISPADIMEFLIYTQDKRDNDAATRARKLSSLKGFFKYLVVTRMLLEENPAANIDSPKLSKSLPKFLSLEESITLLDTVKNDESSKNRIRDYCIVTLFLNCGMRLSELTGLNLSDLDRDLRSLRVIGKGSKERIIYLNDACRDSINDYLAMRDKYTEGTQTDALFISRNRRRISNQTVQWMVYKYLDLAGLGNRSLSVHKLRHTAATLMYQTGEVDVRVLKDILGHEQLNTTQIYTHVSDSSMEKAMQKNPLSKRKK